MFPLNEIWTPTVFPDEVQVPEYSITEFEERGDVAVSVVASAAGNSKSNGSKAIVRFIL